MEKSFYGFFFLTERFKKLFWDILSSALFSPPESSAPIAAKWGGHTRTQVGLTQDGVEHLPAHLTGWSCTQCGGLALYRRALVFSV